MKPFVLHIAPFVSFAHCLLGLVELEAMDYTPSPPRELILEVLSLRPLAIVPPKIIIVSSDDEGSSGRPLLIIDVPSFSAFAITSRPMLQAIWRSAPHGGGLRMMVISTGSSIKPPSRSSAVEPSGLNCLRRCGRVLHRLLPDRLRTTLPNS